jgi:hypothetical protein
MRTRVARAARKAFVVVLCMFGLQLAVSIRTGLSIEDFAAFYTAASLVGTPDIYNRDAHLSFHSERLRMQPRPDLATSLRPPYYSWMISPLTKLPYADALRVWYGILAAALAAFALLFPYGNRLMTLAAVSISVPVILNFKVAQDVPSLLPAIALSLLAFKKNKPFLAGLFLSLCASKFHFFLLLPIALAAKREWKVAQGLAAGGAGLFVASCVIQGGAHWFGEYVNALLLPQINLFPDRMLGFVGLTALLPFKTFLVVVLDCLAVAAAFLASRRQSFPLAVSACLMAGLLISPHSYMHDAIAIIPALLVAAHEIPSLQPSVWLQVTPAFLVLVWMIELSGVAGGRNGAGAYMSLYFLTGMQMYVLARVALARKPADTCPDECGQPQAESVRHTVTAAYILNQG